MCIYIYTSFKTGTASVVCECYHGGGIYFLLGTMSLSAASQHANMLWLVFGCYFAKCCYLNLRTYNNNNHTSTCSTHAVHMHVPAACCYYLYISIRLWVDLNVCLLECVREKGYNYSITCTSPLAWVISSPSYITMKASKNTLYQQTHHALSVS